MMTIFRTGATWGGITLSVLLFFTLTGRLALEIAKESLHASSFQIYILFYSFTMLFSGLGAIGISFLSRFEFLSNRIISPFLKGAIVGAIFITIFLMTPPGLFLFGMSHDAPSSKESENIMIFYAFAILSIGFAAIALKELYRLAKILFYKAVLFLNRVL